MRRIMVALLPVATTSSSNAACAERTCGTSSCGELLRSLNCSSFQTLGCDCGGCCQESISSACSLPCGASTCGALHSQLYCHNTVALGCNCGGCCNDVVLQPMPPAAPLAPPRPSTPDVLLIDLVDGGTECPPPGSSRLLRRLSQTFHLCVNDQASNDAAFRTIAIVVICTVVTLAALSFVMYKIRGSVKNSAFRVKGTSLTSPESPADMKDFVLERMSLKERKALAEGRHRQSIVSEGTPVSPVSFTTTTSTVNEERA